MKLGTCFKCVLMNQQAFLAQMVERWPFKPMVVGSIPTEGVFGYFLDTNCITVTKKKQKKMRRPGIEPGPPAWKAGILPLNYRRFLCIDENKPRDVCLFLCNNFTNQSLWKQRSFRGAVGSA